MSPTLFGRLRRIVSTSETETDILLREERGSPPPVPPPIAAPLLEMGFPLKHIINAINVTKSSGEVSAHTINILASWMLEHPYTEGATGVGESSGGLTRSESTSAVLSKITRSSPVQEVSVFLGILVAILAVFLNGNKKFSFKILQPNNIVLCILNSLCKGSLVYNLLTHFNR